MLISNQDSHALDAVLSNPLSSCLCFFFTPFLICDGVSSFEYIPQFGMQGGARGGSTHWTVGLERSQVRCRIIIRVEVRQIEVEA